MKRDSFNFAVTDHSLGKFITAELYYTISSLLGLGDPGFCSEWLYLSFDYVYSAHVPAIRFLLVVEDIQFDDNEEIEVTRFHLGQLDSAFDEIQIYSSYCLRSEFDPGKEAVNVAFIQSALLNKSKSNTFRPMTLLRGIDRILSQADFSDRKLNNMFNIYGCSAIPEDIRHNFDFGDFGSSRTNFSGDYYLVVRPSGHPFDGVKISNFLVFDSNLTAVEDTIEISDTFIDIKSIQMYDNGKAENMGFKLFKQEPVSKVLTIVNIEDPEEYKSSILPVITETVYKLLVDLSPSTKEKLLSGETIEELIVLCKRKYDQEFDAHFPSLGLAGAHDIAWHEVFSDFNDEAWSDRNED
ncbi:MAG: hypothetical protein JSS73_14615 [Bacteroidetes bacterium]|nr:hypothetical protein [Bacteroidota bacterium]